MDLNKIGKFIARKRKEGGYTQESLAEKMDVSDRAISKWERGISLPDAKNMAKLCKLLGVTYNELFSGEEITGVEYEAHAEKNLREFSEIETSQNKKFFLYENVIGYISSLTFLVLVMTAGFGEGLDMVWRVFLFIFGFLVLIIGVSVCIKIETETGKYKCRKCGYMYVPRYSSVNFAMHVGRTRYMRCPKCHKRSWQKKVI